MTNHEECQELLNAWLTQYCNATDCDRWGQPVEATNSYRSLSNSIEEHTSLDYDIFSDYQKKTLKKISVCLELRSRQLQNPGNCWDGITLDDLMKIEKTLQNLSLNKANKDFPIKHLPAQEIALLPNTRQVDIIDPEGTRAHGTLLPSPLPIDGQTHVTFRIEKIGLKDALQYIDPYITVTVKDSNGANLTVIQDTPLATGKTDTHVMFDVDVHLQRPIQVFPKGFAVFFEFKHFKPKKQKVSSKCWAFMEKDEIKEGQTVIELYRKPTDNKRKKIQLLTVKPLYLHLKISVT